MPLPSGRCPHLPGSRRAPRRFRARRRPRFVCCPTGRVHLPPGEQLHVQILAIAHGDQLANDAVDDRGRRVTLGLADEGIDVGQGQAPGLGEQGGDFGHGCVGGGDETVGEADVVQELFLQATKAGLISKTPAARLQWFAAGERALEVGTQNPCGLFVVLFHRQLWSQITNAQEERARLKLKAFDYGESPI